MLLRKLILCFALLTPVTILAQAPCPVGTNGAAVVLVNDSTTGTTVNKVVSLTSAGNAILYPHAQAVGAVGVAYYGAGSTPNSGVCVQQTGSIPVIADGAVTIQHWVTTSTTTDGNIHDTGTACTANPPAGEVVGCAITASSGAGIAALISLKNFIYATGVTQSGTAISGTTCVIIASGSNTIQCGNAKDTGTYFQPGQILDLQTNALGESSTTAAGTYTVGNLACVTASNTVGDCASAAANQAFIGINLAKNGSTPETAKSGSAATVKSTASVTWTAGDKVCTDASNAATSVDNSTTDCPSPQRQVGIVKTTDGGNTTSHTVDLMFSGTNPATGGSFSPTYYFTANSGGGNFIYGATNTQYLYGIYNDKAAYAVGHLVINVTTADGTGLYSFGIYNSAGTALCTTTAASFSTTGNKSLTCSQGGSITIPTGKLYLSTTGNATTLTVQATQNLNEIYQRQSFGGATSGGTLPSSITAPADTLFFNDSAAPFISFVP